MAEHQVIPYLQEIIIILIAAGILVPLFSRLKLSPVLGYLAVGFIVGPFGLAAIFGSQNILIDYLTINDTADVSYLAEYGIVFLMFMIGLELSPQRLWSMRKLVFGLGALQVILCITAIAVLSALILQADMAMAFVIASAMALSSTAIVMQILTDRHLIATPIGRSCFSILLFQDIAVVPILIIIGLLGMDATGGVGGAVMLALGKAILAILILVLIGHFLLRPIFRLAGSAKGAEPFMAVTLLTVVVAAGVTGQAGLSMALGAFLGGLLLAETEYRHAVEVYIEPFKGLLLGLFFMTVGMGIDVSILRTHGMEILLAVTGLFLLKSGIIACLGMMFGLSRRDAIKAGLLLGQAGEFAFVIIGTATAVNLLPASSGQFLLLVAGLSMVLTPVIAVLARSIGMAFDRQQPATIAHTDFEAAPSMQDHVLIVGFGRVGKAVASILTAEGIAYLAIETNAEVVSTHRKENFPVIYGDALHENFLRHCHPERSQAVLVTMADTKIAAQIIRNIRLHWPDIAIYTRASDLMAARELKRSGSTTVVAETIEASLQLASSVLLGIGADEDVVLRRIELSREYAINRIDAQD